MSSITIQTGTDSRKTANSLAITKSPVTLPPAKLDLMLRRNEDVVVVDVRERELHERGHVPGAINVPPNEWHVSEQLCNDTLNIVYGHSQSCQPAARTFAGRGYQVIELTGGFESWKSNRFEIDAL